MQYHLNTRPRAHAHTYTHARPRTRTFAHTYRHTHSHVRACMCTDPPLGQQVAGGCDRHVHGPPLWHLVHWRGCHVWRHGPELRGVGHGRQAVGARHHRGRGHEGLVAQVGGRSGHLCGWADCLLRAGRGCLGTDSLVRTPHAHQTVRGARKVCARANLKCTRTSTCVLVCACGHTRFSAIPAIYKVCQKVGS